MEFTKRVHTPIVKSKSYTVRYLDIEPIPNMERFEIVTLYIPNFKKALVSAKFKRKRRGYNNVIQHGGVPKKYLFDLSKVKAAIVVGSSLPKPEELPRTLRDRLW